MINLDLNFELRAVESSLLTSLPVTMCYLGPADVRGHEAGHGPVPCSPLVTLASDRQRLMIKIPENAIRRLTRGHGAVNGVGGAHIEIH